MGKSVETERQDVTAERSEETPDRGVILQGKSVWEIVEAYLVRV